MEAQSDKRGNFFDKGPEFVILCTLEMNTAYTKHMLKQAPVNGSVAIWQRGSRHFGVVGTRF